MPEKITRVVGGTGEFVTPDLVTEYTYAARSRNIVHDLADGTVVTVLRPTASARRGKLEMFFKTEADAYRCYMLHSAGGIFRYDPDTTGGASATRRLVYVTDQDSEITWSPTGPDLKRFLVAVQFVETTI